MISNVSRTSRTPRHVRAVPTILMAALLIGGSFTLLFVRDASASEEPSRGAFQTSASQQKADNSGVETGNPKSNGLINIFALVRDKKGNLVTDLNQSNFTLTEDGRPQSIQSFNPPSRAPVTVGLLVDTSANQWRALDEERRASRDFLEQTIRPGTDKAFIIHFDREVELLQDLTDSQQKLQKALDALQPARFDTSSDSNTRDQDSGQYPGGQGRHFHGGAQIYDAVYLACEEILKKVPGRKILILLGSGVDRDSKETLDSALEAAQRTDTMLYALRFKDDEGEDRGNRGGFGGPGMGGGMGPGMGRRGGGQGYPQEQRPDGKKTLDRISSETGGRFVDVSKKLPLEDVYKQIEEELRSQYVLAFAAASAEGSSSAYHKLHLTAKKDFTIQARDGYYSVTKQ